MPKFRVTVKEVWERVLIFETETAEDAWEEVSAGHYEESDGTSFTFSYVLSDETTVEETE